MSHFSSNTLFSMPRFQSRAVMSLLTRLWMFYFIRLPAFLTFPWGVCRTKIESTKSHVVIKFCDVCYIPDSNKLGSEKPFVTPAITLSSLAPLNCWDCGWLYKNCGYVVAQEMFLSQFADTDSEAESVTRSFNLTGALALIIGKSLQSEDITYQIKSSRVKPNITWIFVNERSPLFSRYNIGSKIKNLTSSVAPKINSLVIDTKNDAPLWLKLVSSLSVLLTTFVCFVLTILLRKFDKNSFVYSMELFLHCKRQREKLTVGIFIGRVTVLGSFIGGLFIIVFTLLFTLVPIPFQYILDMCFLLACAACYMFLWARFVILIKRHKSDLTMRFQTLLILPSILFGLAAGVLIVLFKDETYLKKTASMAYNKIGKISAVNFKKLSFPKCVPWIRSC